MHGEIVDKILMIQKIAVTSGTLLSIGGEPGFAVLDTSDLLDRGGLPGSAPDHGGIDLDAA